MEFNREMMMDVLVYHQRLDVGTCACGWSVIGASHAQHVVEVYELSIEALND
jgi:hypothetical protein